MRKCHLNTCPVGVATQDPVLRKRFTGQPEHVINYFFFVAEELREIMAQLGFRTVNEMIGRVDRLDMTQGRSTTGRPRASICRSILYQVDSPSPASPSINCETQDHGLETALDHELIAASQARASRTASRCGSSAASAMSTAPSAPCCRAKWRKRHGHAGLPEDTISVRFTGTAGQSFGAFLARGVSLELTGDANDYVGKGLSGGRIVVRQPQRPPPRSDREHHRRQHRALRRHRRRGLFRGRGGRALRGAQFRRRRRGRRHRRSRLRIHDRRRGGRAGQDRAQFRRRHVGRHRLCLRSQDGDFEQRCNLAMVKLEKIAPADGVDDAEMPAPALASASYDPRHGRSCCASTPSACAS